MVIGRNEGKRLVRCLESIHAADYPANKLDLIYVDSNSTDGSCNAAAKMGATVIKITQGPFNAARARNVGLRAAHHELLHFFDADTVVDGQWLHRSVGAILQHPTVACVTGVIEEANPQASIYMLVAGRDWHVQPGYWRLAGGNVLVRAGVLREHDGYDEQLVAGEEADLCYRLRQSGWRILQLDQTMVRHDLAMMRFAQYWRRAVRSGLSYGMIALRYCRRSEKMWLWETLRNLAEVGSWLVLFGGALVFGLWSLALIVPLMISARVLLVAARTQAGRGGPFSESLAYGVHCQFSKIPLCVGHLMAIKHVVTGTPARLIEYKDT